VSIILGNRLQILMIGCTIILKKVFSDLGVFFFEVECLFHASDFALEFGEFGGMIFLVLCENLLVDLGV
jgi:hypothetical protein